MRYKVWSDSESEIRLQGECFFEDPLDATMFASMWVHRYDGCYQRAILHIEDLDKRETIDTYENITHETIWT